jgi:hypothetical protein
MKVLGIEISGREVRLIALEKKGDDIVNYTNDYKPVKLEDDELASNLVLFKNTLHSTFDSFAPNQIVVKYRNPNGKGQQAPSPISFKIEGIIQLYDKAEISFLKPQTVTAFYKKNTLSLKADYGYQNEALKVAYHYIKSN